LISEEPIVSVVIPAFREGKTIRKVIKDIRSSATYETQIIIVDGYSNDGTEEIAKEENVEFVTEPRLGYGRAIRIGLDHVKGDIIVIIDADGTYEACDINRLSIPLLKDEADVCLASRIGGTLLPGAMPSINFVGNRIFTWLYNIIHGQHVSDTQTGFRAITKKALERLELRVDGMGISTAMLTQAAKNGLRIAEFPTTYKPRNNHSKSKLNRFKAGYDIFSILLSG
jgi:glycosyltransferase involved in cell wall biosynthesis